MSTEKDNTTKQAPGQIDAPEEVALRRRRLLKGAAAAPMVLTLFSGAAIARSSTVVIKAEEYSEIIDIDKDIDKPICVTNATVVDAEKGTYEVETPPDWEAMDPPSQGADSMDDNELFAWYTKQCDEQQGGIVIVASSSTSLIH